MRKILLYSFLFLLALALTGAALVYYVLFFPNAEQSETVSVKIPSGTPFTGIVQILDDQKLLRNRRHFILSAKILKSTTTLKAGKYELDRHWSNRQLLEALSHGQVASQMVTLREGLPARKIAGILQRELELDSARIMDLVYAQDFVRKLGLPATNLEGYLYPDSYRLSWGLTEEQIIKVMVNRFSDLYTDSLERRAEDLGFSQTQVLTLASIIEGEAVIDSERVIISALYHNRLRRGMPLQADPTIQYIIPDGPRRLLNRDLKIDSPYNTYLHAGLPPGPINNPGIRSIRAALFPAQVDYYFMVAKGDGSHAFSYSLSQHLQAKRNFDQVRREVARKKRLEKSRINDQK